MNTETRSISEISRQATHILLKGMGVVDTIRFLNQFSVGRATIQKSVRIGWVIYPWMMQFPKLKLKKRKPSQALKRDPAMQKSRTCRT